MENLESITTKFDKKEIPLVLSESLIYVKNPKLKGILEAGARRYEQMSEESGCYSDSGGSGSYTDIT